MAAVMLGRGAEYDSMAVVIEDSSRKDKLEKVSF